MPHDKGVGMSALSGLMNRKVTRKEFIILVGAGVVSFLGISQKLQATFAAMHQPAQRKTTAAVKPHYGSFGYGGDKK